MTILIEAQSCVVKHHHKTIHQKRRRTKPHTPATKPGETPNISKLAEALGRSKQAVSKWTRRADWPFGPPPWSVEKVREWAAVALAPDPSEALRARLAGAEAAARGGATAEPPMSARWKAELLQIIARTRLLTQEFQRREGMLHDSDACQTRRVQQILAVKERFLNLPRILAPRLAGLKRDDIEREILVAIQAACNAFAGGP